MYWYFVEEARISTDTENDLYYGVHRRRIVLDGGFGTKL